VTIPEDERDPELGTKLQAELPGVLAWAICGCLTWQTEGLNPPEAVTAATQAYLSAEDSITAWIEDCCQRDVNVFTAQGELFRSWKAWAETAGEHIGSQKALMQKLEVRGCVPTRKMAARGLFGLRVLPPEQPAWGGA
jgi:putative DNA primase/helicase